MELPTRKELNDAFATILRLADFCDNLHGTLQRAESVLQQKERYVGITEAASMLGVTRQTVSSYVRKGILPVVLRGTKRLIKESEIQKIL